MNSADITIRKAKISDAKALLDIYAPYVKKTAVTFEYEVPSLEEFEKRIAGTLKKFPYLVAEKDNSIVGYAYAGAFKERAAYSWAAETTVYIKEDMKKLGIGRKLYTSLEDILKQLNFTNLNACIAYPPDNDPYLTKDSFEFHSRLGYSLVGTFHKCGYKFNRWYDMVWMEKHIGEHMDNQPLVKIFNEIE